MGVEEGKVAKRHRTADRSDAPRAIIHKQILDEAKERPGASMETIADAVSGATTTTVERVLEEYGDPGVDEGSAGDAGSDESTPDGAPEDTAAHALSDGGTTSTDDAARSDEPATADGPPRGDESPSTPERSAESELDRSTLTEKQYETLHAIHRDPDATQAELADELGVSSPTISQRVNSIDGFDWSNRRALVDPLFEADDSSAVSASGKRSAHAADDADSEAASSSSSEADEEPLRAGTAGVGHDSNDERSADSDARRTRPDERRVDSHDECIGADRRAELIDRVDDLARQVTALEKELSTLASPESTHCSDPAVLSDPELAHKIVHACIDSDRITEEEELRLLRAVTTGSSGSADGASVDCH